MDIALTKQYSYKKGKEEGRAEGLKEGRAEGLEEGEAKGIVKGEAKKQLEIARAMKADGVEVNVIVKYTGLTEEQIKAL